MERSHALAAAERFFAGREVQFDPNVHEVLGGECAVHGQQQHRGVSIYPHSVVVRVAASGEVTAEGNPLIDAGGVEIVPRMGAGAAARAAMLHIRNGGGGSCHTAHDPRPSMRGYRPRVVAAFPMPNQPTVLTAGPFDEPVQANLVIHRDSARLAWLVWLFLEGVADYTIAVAAAGSDAGAVLYCAVEAASAVCSARVFLFNPDEAPRVLVTFPRPAGDYPPGIRPPSEFRDWVASNRAFGNNVETLFANQNPKIRLTSGGPAGKQFVTANVADEQVINAFHLCNFAHDFFSLIGFDETHGNFQQENFSGFGKGGDRLIVSIVQSAQGEANVRGQNDGKPVELTLGKWSGAKGKPTAMDADIVLHEYTHAVSQRLVGGKQKKGALLEPQSVALGEAWSDYFAITIQNFYRAAPRFTFGAYASQRPNGIRPTETNPVPYDQFTRSSGHFGMLGRPPFDEKHAAGSIFAAALLRMQEELRALLGNAAGHETGWLLVLASLKTVPANPTFLDARKEILAAAASLAGPQSAAMDAAIRGAFARFGMGRNASCLDTSLGRTTADFNP